MNKIERWSRDGSAKKYTNKICRDNVSHPLYIPTLAFWVAMHTHNIIYGAHACRNGKSILYTQGLISISIVVILLNYMLNQMCMRKASVVALLCIYCIHKSSKCWFTYFSHSHNIIVLHFYNTSSMYTSKNIKEVDRATY